MPSPVAPHAASSGRSRLSAGRWAVVGVFALLTLGFVYRLLENAYHWFRGTSSADVNYKALAVWCLVYALVCGGLAAFAYWLPREDDERPVE